MYALILAGGVGSRMWPKSRQATPKQFLDLTGGETMIQTTVRRILPLVAPERIVVVTGERYVKLVQAQLPALPAENIIAESSGKNTAPAIGLGAMAIAQKDPQAVMAVLTADHIIPQEDVFRQALQAADEVAQTGKLVTLGITPTGPETGYGYIHRGKVVGNYQEQTVYQVARFLEKPSREKAEQFYQSGEYYWNSGMFIWQTQTLFAEMKQAMPTLMKKLEEIQAVQANPTEAKAIWAQIESQSIDFGLMEKTSNVAVVPLNAGWNDVGSWAALYQELAAQPGDNVVVNAQHLAIDSHGILIQGDGKLIATIGVQNLAVIQTEDALLICHQNQVQDVKTVVNQLKDNQQQDYL